LLRHCPCHDFGTKRPRSPEIGTKNPELVPNGVRVAFSEVASFHPRRAPGLAILAERVHFVPMLSRRQICRSMFSNCSIESRRIPAREECAAAF
jgi:hypothetical protein